jgi:glycosyltransferase involved in cell wall biosynthesis
MGGGEKYAATIAEVLSQAHDVELITYQPLDKKMLEANLDVDLSRVEIRSIPDISDARTAEYVTGDYDLFINSSYMTALPSRAKRSVLVVFFPASFVNDLNLLERAGIRILQPVASRVTKNTLVFQPESDGTVGIMEVDTDSNLRAAIRGWMAGLPPRVSNMPRSMEFLQSYSKIISISEYSRAWVKRYWGLESELVYPPVMDSNRSDRPGLVNRRKRILSVGRFFTGGHSKKQLEMVKVFKEQTKKDLNGWELHLAGGTHPEHKEYIKRIEEEARGYPVFCHFDISRGELEELYRTSRLFWHASGYGEDEESHPEAQEHFGITTVEAMAHGLVPLVYDGGGQREIVSDGVDGYLWRTFDELIAKTVVIAGDERLREEMAGRALSRSNDFTGDLFKQRLMAVLEPLIEGSS